MEVKRYGKRWFKSCPSVNANKVIFLGALNPTQKKEFNALEGKEVIDILDPSFSFSMEGF